MNPKIWKHKFAECFKESGRQNSDEQVSLEVKIRCIFLESAIDFVVLGIERLLTKKSTPIKKIYIYKKIEI